MKKIISAILCLGVAVAAGAQNWQDAQILSENQYGGTARSVGMGNALTAVGGDPGSLTLNPAGSSVSAYSQFFITPGVSVSVSGAQGITFLDNETEAVGLGDKVNSGIVRMKLPNAGFIFSFDKGRRSGWKRSAFGFVVNSTADYTSRFKASGLNSTTSYAASLASSADGYSTDVLGSGDWFYNGGDASQKPAWADMTGYRAGMFNGISGRPGGYVAVTEVLGEDGKVYMGDPIQQRYGLQTTGGKHDILFNYSANYSDILYLGGTLGITTLNYNRNMYFQELPDNPDDYPLIEYTDGTSARFQSLRMRESLRLTGSGVYFKVGALYRPLPGLRLGAAIQTPTRITLRERFGYAADVQMSGKYTPSASSPENDWHYSLVLPFRANAGIAYSFGNFAVLSADYEIAHNGGARFDDTYSSDSEDIAYMNGVNKDIRNLMGFSQQVRAGFEFKPAPFMAVRVGYNYSTSGEKACYQNGKLVALTSVQKAAKSKTAVSFGLGWNAGSLFADLAVRMRFLPKEYFIPYEYYYAPDAANPYYKVVDEGFLTPEVEVGSYLIDAMFTLGWRF